MQNYFENGYSTFLNIDSLTLALGKGFGNDTINSSNLDAFIETDALPVSETTTTEVTTGYNVYINNTQVDNVARVEIRNGTTVVAGFGAYPDSISNGQTELHTEVVFASNYYGNEADPLGIYNGGASGGLTVFIDAQGFDPSGGGVGLGYNVHWQYLALANNEGSVYMPSGTDWDGVIQYYDDLGGTTQFQGYMGGANYTFDMTLI